MSLVAHLVVARAAFDLDVRLDVAADEVVALLGPNGAGKSTALHALAGLVPLAAGSVALAGQVLEDRRARLPPEARPIGVVFQDYLLFPHLSALDNVAFGPRARGTPRPAARALAATWLERFGLGELRHRRPSELSGGQAQRVALARALATDPALLLLDEPLAALDAATRLEVRSELRRHLVDAGRATVVVTHDPLEAMVLADRLVVVEGGRVVQVGTPAQVATRPRTAYVAALVGLNLWQGQAAVDGVTLDGGGRLIAASVATGPVLVTVRPSAVSLHPHPPGGSPRNVWPTRVDTVELVGDRVRVGLVGSPPVLADVTPATVAELDLHPGRSVWAAVKATEVTTYAR